jgi:hypothetical protein
MMKDFKINFALADSSYLTAVRLVVGAICAQSDVDLDCTEDFKVCVTESCLILKNCGFDRAEITFKKGDGQNKSNVVAEVCGIGGTPCEGDNELSLALVSALVASCKIEKTQNVIGKVILGI